MKASFFLLISILLLSSCSNDEGKYAGTFRNIDTKAFAPEFVVRHISRSKYQISYLEGAMIENGIRKRNIITANALELPDSSSQIYEYSPDCNTISVSSINSNVVETYIRVR